MCDGRQFVCTPFRVCVVSSVAHLIFKHMSAMCVRDASAEIGDANSPGGYARDTVACAGSNGDGASHYVCLMI